MFRNIVYENRVSESCKTCIFVNIGQRVNNRSVIAGDRILQAAGSVWARCYSCPVARHAALDNRQGAQLPAEFITSSDHKQAARYSGNKVQVYSYSWQSDWYFNEEAHPTFFT